MQIDYGELQKVTESHRIPHPPDSQAPRNVLYYLDRCRVRDEKRHETVKKITRISQKPENTEFIYEDTIIRNLHSVHERPAGG